MAVFEAKFDQTRRAYQGQLAFYGCFDVILVLKMANWMPVAQLVF